MKEGIGGGGRIRTDDLWVMSPTSYLTAPPRIVLIGFCGAGNEARTRDIQLGRLTLYQLSYSRNKTAHYRLTQNCLSNFFLFETFTSVEKFHAKPEENKLLEGSKYSNDCHTRPICPHLQIDPLCQ